MPPQGKDEENLVLSVSSVSGPLRLLTPAESPELSNSTEAVLSSLQTVIALSAFAKNDGKGPCNQVMLISLVLLKPPEQFQFPYLMHELSCPASRSRAKLTVAQL